MIALSEPVNTRVKTGLLIWSLLLGGVEIHVSGRMPTVLYFDLVLILWLVYYVLFEGFYLSLADWVVRLGIFCVLSGMLSAVVNYRDVYKSLAAIKILACGLLFYAICRKAPPSILTLSLWGALAGVLLLLDYRAVRLEDFGDDAQLAKNGIGIVLGKSNYVASILVLLIPLSVAGVSFSKGTLRFLYAFCAILTLGGLIATLSRGAIGALVLATILSLPLLFRAGMRLKHIFAALLLGGLLFVLLPSDLVRDNIALFAYRMANPDERRSELMAATWEVFKENPLVGVGPGQLGNAILYSATDVPSGQFLTSHNLVLNTLAENGLISGMVFLAIICIVLSRAYAAAAAQPTALNVALFLGLLAATLHNMVEASIDGEQFQIVFWAVAAIAVRNCPLRPLFEDADAIVGGVS